MSEEVITKHKVAVYGTLRTGEGPTSTVKGRLYDLGWYPGIILDDDGYDITIEYREVDDEGLQGFDRYEGYYEDDPSSSLYLRTRLGDVWIYEFNRPVEGYSLIEGGDWLKYNYEKE
jgi:gamma-glutamylcyclotransferase (GGCT)/AIG2-like uncharacterized protein YtfP